MNEQEWRDCSQPEAMLRFLRKGSSDRKMRLFGVACCRHIWHFLPATPWHHCIQVAERYADRAASDKELREVRKLITFALYRQEDDEDKVVSLLEELLVALLKSQGK